jgi:NADH-quinone oxidoreductase subunit C/D
MFTDRKKAYDVIEAITGFRMHPAWYRIGGVAHDLPKGWDRLVRDFVEWLPKRLDEYEKAAMKNGVLKARTIGVAQYNAKEALEWGVTGPGLRATGIDYDLRKARPYSGYENFDFEVPLAHNGDAYDRGMLRLEEMRQSVKIIKQCLENMPEGPYKADHPLTCPPPKERTLQHIETLITHFLSVSWGPVLQAGDQRYQQLLFDGGWCGNELSHAYPYAKFRPSAANSFGNSRQHDSRFDRLFGEY